MTDFSQAAQALDDRLAATEANAGILHHHAARTGGRVSDCQGCAAGMHFLHTTQDPEYGPRGLVIRDVCVCVGECEELDDEEET